MKALITYTSLTFYNESDKKVRIEEITTLEQVIEMAKKEGKDVIVILEKYPWNIEKYGDYDIELEVYDDYRE